MIRRSSASVSESVAASDAPSDVGTDRKSSGANVRRIGTSAAVTVRRSRRVDLRPRSVTIHPETRTSNYTTVGARKRPAGGGAGRDRRNGASADHDAAVRLHGERLAGAQAAEIVGSYDDDGDWPLIHLVGNNGGERQ